ncbi:DUF1800 domain-containing protein [Pedobacter sp. SYP-B3415]|uniref:DUF1800 domain-containing protein n=1 Tax=Pedobacter sp. SYP-B3415 TaxID=2496641 RepID=UPI001F11260B|nr:DUF1800 domain-containing protein [Pedobacter sp. SYP-B3415]
MNWFNLFPDRLNHFLLNRSEGEISSCAMVILTTRKFFAGLVMAGVLVVLAAFTERRSEQSSFPWQKAGLTEQQAAAHLLSRFTYGATPEQIEQVRRAGLENWFEDQLRGVPENEDLKRRLGSFDAIALSNAAVVQRYPRNARVVRMAIAEGAIHKDSIRTGDRAAYREMLQNYMKQNDLRPQQELFRQFISQKILRAVYSENQLQEIMTDFWFNHFNVSLTKPQCAEFIPAYERDVIRPGATGKFGDLLLATAKSPAMLYYLDNFSSSGTPKMESEFPQTAYRRKFVRNAPNAVKTKGKGRGKPKQAKPKKKAAGLNENYAREVMELHTLGVDGGYTQKDVTEAAKVLTGWTVSPLGQYQNVKGRPVPALRTGAAMRPGASFRDGDFLFAANRHEGGVKTVLGKKFGPNAGYDEGVELLEMLARHPSTAKFISTKLAIRFVSDQPEKSLIDKMSRAFAKSGGDIRTVLRTMVSAPEFWSAAVLREKTKSPFELAIGAVRSLHADVQQPYQLFSWITRMGERKYYYQAPTGFPDQAQYWINTGALLNRMNFGLALAAGKIPGIQIDLRKLNGNREPESVSNALALYAARILPERELTPIIKKLEPMLSQPDLLNKVEEASAKAASREAQGTMGTAMPINKVSSGKHRMAAKAQSTDMLAQVVGVIIGSPEYQKR